MLLLSTIYYFTTSTINLMPDKEAANHQRRSIRKVFLKILRKFKTPGSEYLNFITKETPPQVFSCESCKTF